MLCRPFRFYINTTPFLLENQKKRGFGLKEKFFYPLLFAPANAVPFQKGTKTLHRTNIISNIDRRRSESATVFILSFWLGYITAAKKERLLLYEILPKGGIFLFFIGPAFPFRFG